MDRLTISPKRDDWKKERKSRAFSVRLIGYISADPLWDLGRSADRIERPVWLSYTGTEQEVRAFTANVRTGRKIRRISTAYDRERECEQIEVPKSAGFRYQAQHGPSGTTVLTAYHPGLWHLEPAEVPGDRIKFLCAPPSWWVEAQLPKAREILGELDDEQARDAVVCGMVAAYLDRRSPLPIVQDLGLHRQLVAACFKGGPGEELGRPPLLFERTPEHNRGMPNAMPSKIPGLDRMIACSATQNDFAALLQEVTAIYYKDEIQAARLRARRREVPEVEPVMVLPEPPAEPAQLSLF